MATEKRLIDANRVIDQMQKCIDESPYERDSIASYTFGAIIECLKKEPTVDAVEVVRCKDCASGKGSTHKVCPLYKQGLMKDEDFCSKGERK